MENIMEQLNNYIRSHSTPEDPLLELLYRETYLKTIYPKMISGPLLGKLLEFISRMIHPNYILEIGTFTGYSAICLVKGLAEGGKLITIEINDEVIQYSRKYFQEAGIFEKVELIKGNALEIVPALHYTFDLIFIDADKKEYISYYNIAVDKLVHGGFIIIDNVLWGGKVTDTSKHSDQETRQIRKLNDLIINDSRVENIILPIRDGINLIRKI